MNMSAFVADTGSTRIRIFLADVQSSLFSLRKFRCYCFIGDAVFSLIALFELIFTFARFECMFIFARPESSRLAMSLRD